MGIKEKDIKLLWGRAGNRCSIPNCRIKLSHDKKTATESFPIGEQAHIVGKEEGSARSKSILSMEDRDSYHNLILLCPTHHTVIDKNVEDYPVEKIHMIKSQHEVWVDTTLSESNERKLSADEIAYTHLIDMSVEDCLFSAWENWISALYSTSHQLEINTYDKIIQYTFKMYKAVWPGTKVELESALKYFSEMMNIMLGFYMKNADSKGEYYIEDRSYKKRWWPQEIFDELSEKNRCWGEYLDELIIEITKVANWLADIIRKEINPMFMITDGKFSLIWGPDENLSYRIMVPEYSSDEKQILIKSHEEKSNKMRDKANSIEV